MHEAVEAIVVGRTDLGEADRIVRLLTPDQGRVDVVARGARASRRRFAGALEPGTRVLARWRRGRGQLPTLEAADLVSQPRRVRDSYDRLLLLTYGCEVVATLSQAGLEGARGFRLLEAWLALLEADVGPDAASRVALEAKALTFAGLTPALSLCPGCGRILDGEVRFDPEAGGGVHAACGRGERVPLEGLRVLEALRRTPLADTPGRPVPGPVRWILADFLEHHARRGLKTRAVLETMESP